MELLKEAVPKVAHLAALYEPRLPSNIHEVKEVLQIAARALGLTFRPWEIRNADGFEQVFTELSKDPPDGLYVVGGPLMIENRKRIVSFALTRRLSGVPEQGVCRCGRILIIRGGPH